MLGIMFSSEIRGVLAINGILMDNKAIAKRFGKDINIINELVDELEEARVFSRLENGAIYSRRMYRRSKRKEEIGRIRSQAGKKGMEKRWGKDDNKPIASGDNKSITNITASTSSPTPTPTPNSKSNVLFDKDSIEMEFDYLWKSWPSDRHGNKKTALRKYRAVRSKYPIERINKAFHGYMDYLKDMKLNENFDQKMKFLSTWLNEDNWKVNEHFKYTARL